MKLENPYGGIAMIIDKSKVVEGLKIWELPAQNIKEISPVCRNVAADGAVLIKNENGVLPFRTRRKSLSLAESKPPIIKAEQARAAW